MWCEVFGFLKAKQQLQHSSSGPVQRPKSRARASIQSFCKSNSSMVEVVSPNITAACAGVQKKEPWELKQIPDRAKAYQYLAPVRVVALQPNGVQFAETLLAWISR